MTESRPSLADSAEPQRLVVLISGGGTNLQAILDACSRSTEDPDHLAATVVAVVSNRADAGGLVRAERAGVPSLVLERLPGERRADYDRRLVELVDEYEPDLVVLAGFMRLLTSTFLDRFGAINLHPALPGTFPGLEAIERAFAAWQAGEIDESGVMVHHVPDEGVDDGPVIAAESVPFVEGDTLASFADRLHAVEHRLLVDAIRSLTPTGVPS